MRKDMPGKSTCNVLAYKRCLLRKRNVRRHKKRIMKEIMPDKALQLRERWFVCKISLWQIIKQGKGVFVYSKKGM